jgi:hypothetical protein
MQALDNESLTCGPDDGDCGENEREMCEEKNRNANGHENAPGVENSLRQFCSQQRLRAVNISTA